MSETSDSDQKEDEWVDEGRRKFLLTAAYALGGTGILCILAPLASSWLPGDRAEANAAPVEVDLSALQPGGQMIVSWRGKPVWIIRRTPEMLKRLVANNSKLRDPGSLTPQQPIYATNQYRSINPEYLVLVGLCTHLGCSPKYRPIVGDLSPDWSGGFLCPCHGSTFDLAGRVFKDMPAPINLEVPPHYFRNTTTLVIGIDK